jgi:short-subunit dehydrogenase
MNVSVSHRLCLAKGQDDTMPLSLKPIARQVIVITGASSGIGLVTARAAARRGASVMLVARGGDALQAIVAEIEAAGGRAGWAVADVADPAAVRAAAARAIAVFGRIDSWVNCAGVAIYGKLAETPEDEHQRLFQTNYFGVVHGALTALEHLRSSGGAIVTVGSIAGDIPSPIMGAYDASKHAVKGFIGSLRIEVMADALPVSITLIKPAGMNTPIAEHAANHLRGEALIPPPVYDPALVADTIIDALQHPRREVTVGGVGRLQVLLGSHFPGVLARLGGLIIPLLSDTRRPKTPGSNLAGPISDGRERSRHEPGRRVSAYAVGQRHTVALAAVSAATVALAVLLRYRTRTPR